MSDNKFGAYIQRLMTTVIDKEQEGFVQDLAFSELRRLNIDIDEFLRKHAKDESKEIEKTEKQLLQEDKQEEK